MTTSDEVANEDWIKTLHWDLGVNVDLLEQRFDLAALVKLPAFDAAPPGVRAEILRRLRK